MVTACVVIVGAGPSGLAAAFLLAKAGCSVTVLDRLDEPWKADSTRAIGYAVSSHGFPVIERMGLLDALKSYGVDISGVRMLIYSPGKTPHKTPPLKRASLTIMLSRESLLEIMFDRVREQGLVDFRLGVSVGAVTYSRAGATVQLLDSNGGPIGMLHADLVLGCDGVRSAVRRQLAAGGSNVESTRSFELQKMTSPATRLAYKSLSFVPNPRLPPLKGEKEHIVLPTELIDLRDRLSGLTQLRLVAFPVGSDPSIPRIATLVARPDAAVWQTTDVDEAYDMLQNLFPYVDLRKLVDREEMAAFASGRPTQFSCIQRSESLAAWCGDNAGVALVGDAAKCFPPDLGQGLNSSLEDVAVLVDAIAEAACVREALQLYEERRDADINGIMRLVQIGFPYQYRQNVPMFYLWMANIGFRSILAKVAPRVFNPPAIVLTHTCQYAEALRKADETTSRIRAIMLASVALGLGILLARRKSDI